MDENTIRVLIANARDLLKYYSTCQTDDEFSLFMDRMTDTAVKASEAIQKIAHVDAHEAAEIFMAMVESDAKRETFIAQAFVAQVPACA